MHKTRISGHWRPLTSTGMGSGISREDAVAAARWVNPTELTGNSHTLTHRRTN